MQAAHAMEVALASGASIDEMQRVLLQNVTQADLMKAIRGAAQQQREAASNSSAPSQAGRPRSLRRLLVVLRL